MSDQELLKNNFESGLEMIRRNMVGAVIWKTGEGVITNSSKEAREATLNIYHQELQSGFQQVLEECSLKAARTQDRSTRGDRTFVPFQVSKTQKLERQVSLREVVKKKNGYFTVRLTVRVDPPLRSAVL